MKAEPPKVNKTVTKVKADDKTAFIGLNAYSEKQADFFFGRDEEITELSSLVKISSLTLLFGKSGTGKTSLLNAGVFPVLRKEFCMPFRIRLNFLKDSPDIITQIKQVLKSQIDEYGFNVESYPGTETLWEYFHREPLWKLVTPILVFDQFEEIFTLAQKNPQYKKEDFEAFVEELSSVIENEVPRKVKEQYLKENEHISFLHNQQKVKIIFSFREDYLPEFESFSARIPSIKNARFRLMPMNGSQAFEVITKTWGNAIEEAEAAKIVHFLTNHSTGETTGASKYVSTDFESMVIEPSLLSQVCSFIDKNRKIEGLKKVSAGFLRKYPKNIILRSLYNEVLVEGDQAIARAAKDNYQLQGQLQEFIEDNLVTDDGFRTRYIIHKIETALKPGINLLTGKYFIREEGDTIELTHDVIVALVTADRDKRRKALAVAEADRRAKRRVFFISILAILLAIASWLYITHEASVKNDQLLATNESLTTTNDSLSAKNDSLKDDIAKSIFSQKNNINTDRSQHSLTTEDGLKLDSNSLAISKLKDSLIGTQNSNKSQVQSLTKEKEKLTADLAIIEREKKNFKNRLDSLLKQSEKYITFPRVSDSLKMIMGYNNRINKQLEEYKKTDFEYLFRIDSLRNKIIILESKLSRYDRLFEAGRYPKSKEKIFGYGYDYAEDKVKKP